MKTFECVVEKKDAIASIKDLFENSTLGKKELRDFRMKLILPSVIIVSAYWFLFKNNIMTAALSLFFILLILGLKQFIIKRHKKEFDKPIYANRFGLAVYTIDEKGIKKESGGISITVSWKAIADYRKTSELIWIKAEGNNMLIIPQRSFSSPTEFENVYRTIEANLSI